MKKGYVVVTEEIRDYETATTVNVGETVYTDLDEAFEEFNEIVRDAKTNTAGDFSWVAETLEENPGDIVEQWATGRWVTFHGKFDGDRLDIYIHEVTIK